MGQRGNHLFKNVARMKARGGKDTSLVEISMEEERVGHATY